MQLAGSLEAFQTLRAAGADIRAQTPNGFTVLHRAVVVGDAATVRELLDVGLNPNATTRSGWTPLHAARSREAFEALRTAGADSGVIERAFSPEKLLEATQTSTSGRDQLRLLNWAVEQVGRYLDAVWLPSLRAVNPDFHAVPHNYGRNNAGAFPLHYAARHNEDPAAIAALLGDGVDVDSMQGGTPALALAARSNGNPAVVEAWLEAGTNMNAAEGRAFHNAA